MNLNSLPVHVQHPLPERLHLVTDHALGLLLEIALGDGGVKFFAGHFDYRLLKLLPFLAD